MMWYGTRANITSIKMQREKIHNFILKKKNEKGAENEVNDEILKLKSTFETIISKYNEGSMLNNDDNMLSWVAQCDWLVKQLVDLKVGAGFKYFELQKEYDPLKKNSNVGEGDESE